MPPTQRQTEARAKAEKATAQAGDTPKTLPEQDFQEQPNPDLQAALTSPAADPVEQHIVDENPDDADRRSAEAPGIRTEPEVIADHVAANERAAAALAATAHTADPAASTSAVKMPRVENRDRLVHYKRRSTGDTVSVNEGTPEHGILIGDADFEPTDAPSAKDRKAADEALGRFSTAAAEKRATR